MMSSDRNTDSYGSGNSGLGNSSSDSYGSSNKREFSNQSSGFGSSGRGMILLQCWFTTFKPLTSDILDNEYGSNTSSSGYNDNSNSSFGSSGQTGHHKKEGFADKMIDGAARIAKDKF